MRHEWHLQEMGSREKAVQEGEEQYGQKYGRETVDDAVLRDSGLPTPLFLGSPGGSDSKESARNVRLEFDSWVGKIPRRRAW